MSQGEIGLFFLRVGLNLVLMKGVALTAFSHSTKAGWKTAVAPIPHRQHSKHAVLGTVSTHSGPSGSFLVFTGGSIAPLKPTATITP